jgi:hypothetical protein
MSTTQHGYFLIADITGYTAYLSASELEHAQQTLTALLNLLIKHTKPPLIISRLAGDAVISYGLRDNFFQGQTFVEMIEDTYVAFRRAIDLMVLNTTCDCNACRNINTLDLKFFVHYGEFGIQKLDNHDEMVGADVIVIHRLLKNTVTEKTGCRAYALYTDAAIKQLRLEDICATMTPHEEQYEHLGTVPLWVQDMHPVWLAKKDQVRMAIPPGKVLIQPSAIFRATPEQIWDYLVQEEHFNVFAAGTKTVIVNRQGGRVTAGATYQCYHGDSFLPLTILEWRPFERVFVRATPPIPVKGVSLLIEIRLEPAPEGTRFTQVFGKAEGPWLGRALCDLLFKGMAKQAQRDIDAFGRHIEADLAQRVPAPAGFAPPPEMVGAAAAESLAG